LKAIKGPFSTLFLPYQKKKGWEDSSLFLYLFFDW